MNLLTRTSRPIPTVTRLALVSTLAASALVLSPALEPLTVSSTLPAAVAAETTASKQVTVASVLNEDGSITITGSGWVSSTPGRGAVVAFKWDGGAVHNKELPNHPLDGKPLEDPRFANVNFYALADEDGNFSLDVKLPTSETTDVKDEDWQAGSEHKLTALAGSVGEGDSPGNYTASFTVPGGTADDVDSWPTLEADGATVKISPVKTGNGATIRLIGQGWTRQQGGGSTVSIKLEYLDDQGTVRQYERTDSAISDYLRSVGRAADPTSWGLLIPDESQTKPDQGLVAIGEDGSFDVTLELPEGVQQGQTGDYLAVFIQSGRNADGDTSRSARSEAIPVNGVAGSLPATDDNDTVCTTDVTTPTFRIVNPEVELGGRLHVTGEGWCNTENTRATKVAVKIDEGGISRLDSSLHSNRTIWAILEPDAASGRIDAYIDLPDGTTATSTPALEEGAHSLRVLSGSLASGDRSISLGGPDKLGFVVGEYAPNQVPDTLAAEEITDEVKREVKVSLDGLRVTATVPEAEPGQWVILNPYIGGSVRSNWGSGWVQLDQNRSLTYTLPEALAAGDYQMVVQSGERDDYGQLLGWAPLTVAKTPNEQQISGSNRATGSSSTGSNSTLGAVAQANSSNSGSSSVRAPYTAAAANATQSPSVAQQTSISQVLRAPAAKKTASSSASQQASASASTSASATPSSSASQEGRSSEDQATSIGSSSEQTSAWRDVNNWLLIAAAAVLLGTLALTRKSPKKS